MGLHTENAMDRICGGVGHQLVYIVEGKTVLDRYNHDDVG